MTRKLPSTFDHAALLEQLRKGPWFRGLPTDLQALIVRHSAVRTYRRREFIVRQGEPTRGMFGVLEGRIHGVNRIGSVIADSAVKVLNLPQPQFARIVSDEPRYCPIFAQLLIEQFAFVFRYLGEVQGLAPEEWLLARLKDAVAARQREHPTATPADEITVSQADLATMIGVSRQTLSTLLSRLKQRGLIEVKFRRIRVLA